MALPDRADKGKPYPGCLDANLVSQALNPNWDEPIIVPEGQWVLPAGAFGEGGGPN